MSTSYKLPMMPDGDSVDFAQSVKDMGEYHTKDFLQIMFEWGFAKGHTKGCELHKSAKFLRSGMFAHLSEHGLRDLLERPHTKDFLEAAQIEAAHQTARWGEDHDTNKSPEDWLWVVAYLSTKAIQAERYGDREQYLHHIITAAAAMANWHRIETDHHKTSPEDSK